MRTVKLNTSVDEIDKTHLAGDARKTRFVQIERDVLRNLLLDHSVLVRALADEGYEIFRPNGNGEHEREL